MKSDDKFNFAKKTNEKSRDKVKEINFLKKESNIKDANDFFDLNNNNKAIDNKKITKDNFFD